MIFYISQKPTKIEFIEEGFCFDEQTCGPDGFFGTVRAMLDNQVLMFVKVQRNMKEPPSWFPHRVQFELKYWQRTQAEKTLINGRVLLQEFAPLDDYYSAQHAQSPFDVTDLTNVEGLRGHQYDLR